MASVQKLPVPSFGMTNSYEPCKVEEAAANRFPAGLRVLVVDDDTTCLRILEHMLRKCLYHVTSCSRATIALSLLRQRKGDFDLVISDVHMPDMDGFKLLEHVGLEMDLPVIMMSADGRTNVVMRGIKHGACDYLIKPVRMEELKNIWQHVARKKLTGNKELDHSGSLDDSDRQRRGADDVEYASAINDGTDSNWKTHKKKRDGKEDEDDCEVDNDDASASKRPRVVWSVELHHQFVNAVNQLGIDKAVPKRILELMNVPGLTRENVASHLQKFRLYLKRLNGVTQHQGGIPNPYCGSVETNSKVNPQGRLDFQAFASSSQSLAALHGIMLPGLDQPSLLQSSIPSSNCIPIERRVPIGQPQLQCQTNMYKQFPQSDVGLEDMSSGFASWSPNHLNSGCTTSNLGGLNNLQSTTALTQMLPQQPQPVLSEPGHALNVQPSCLIAPAQSSDNYQVGDSAAPINQNCPLVPAQPSGTFHVGNTPALIRQNSSYSNCSTILDYSMISSRTTNISRIGQIPDGDFKSTGLPNGYPIPGSVSSPATSGSVHTDGSTNWTAQELVTTSIPSSRLPGSVPNLGGMRVSGTMTGTLPDQGQVKNLGFVGKRTCLPSRFAVDDIESPTDDLNQRNTSVSDDGSRVKPEIHLDFMEGSRVGNPVVQHFRQSDCMGVLSK